MAREIIDLTNVHPPDADYPNGRVKDNPGNGTGTPVTEQMTGDMLQFFNRLLDISGITPNHLPDNDYSGYQLYEAFETVVNQYIAVVASQKAAIVQENWSNIGDAGKPAFANSWTNTSLVTYLPARYRQNNFVTIELGGNIFGGASNTIAFTLPLLYRPAKTVIFPVFSAGSGTDGAAFITINASGQVLVTYAGSSGNVNISLDGISFHLN